MRTKTREKNNSAENISQLIVLSIYKKIIYFTLHLMSFIDDATCLRKSRLHQILGQLSLWLLRSTNTMRPKVYQGSVVLLLATTLIKLIKFL